MQVYIEETILVAVMRKDEDTAAAKLREMDRRELRAFKQSVQRLEQLITIEEDRQYDAVT